MSEHGRGWRTAAVGALAAWAAATILSNHPHRTFDRLRRTPLGPAIPDWRFFAPEPGQWDNHVMVRTLGTDGEVTPWRALNTYAARRLHHAVYYPGHRHEKAVFDVASALMLTSSTSQEDLVDTTDYQLLSAHIEHRLREQHAGGPLPRGFQFLLVRDAGYAAGEELEARLVSRLEPFE